MSADHPAPPPSTLAPDDLHAYCRDVEAYLCRRNDGHLIRIVGPAFELVKDWATDGIPLTVVREAIDRVVERAEKKLTRRRPIRIEFCDGDVRDGYDRWRRAVGVTRETAPTDVPGTPRRGSLHAHVERVAVLLAAALGSDRAPATVQPAVQAALSALDGLREASSSARGAARDAVLDALAALDRTLLIEAEGALSPARLQALEAEAVRELAPFRGRLPATQWDAAVGAARARLVRAAVHVPIVSFD